MMKQKNDKKKNLINQGASQTVLNNGYPIMPIEEVPVCYVVKPPYFSDAFIVVKKETHQQSPSLIPVTLYI